MKLNQTHQSILLVGLEDEIHMGDFPFRLRRFEYLGKNPSNELIRDESLQVIQDLLQAGFIEAVIPKWDKSDAEIQAIKANARKGEYVETLRKIGPPKWERWTLSPEECIQHIRQEWDALGREPMAGDIVWFRLTPLGEQVGRQIDEGDGTLAPIEWDLDANPPRGFPAH